MPGFLARLLLVGALLLAGCAHETTLAPSVPRPAGPHDAFVLLSGGGSPTSNNYSQYLQARAMAGFLQRSYPPEAVWTFFGLGHQPGGRPALTDVHRKVKRDGLLLSTWLPGELPRNRPARKQDFLRALREEILPRVAPGGTLYLFVGDHGELTRGAQGESAITMWQLEPMPNGGWKPDPEARLTVTELREAIAAGIGRGRVIFCMTQCHSGGFHFVGVPRRVAGDPAWYRSPPAEEIRAAWLAATGGLPVAGFTATDEPSLAAGCAPDPDPDRWAGYERYIPEALLGLDLLDPSVRRAPLPSFGAAHEAATLIDRTIDKPLASSDQYLEGWAAWIDAAAANPAGLRPEIADKLAVYQAVLDGRGAGPVADRAFRAKQAQFERFTASLTARYPAMRDLLTRGTREEIERARGDERTSPGRPSPERRPRADLVKLWTDTLRPAWKAALLAGQAGDLPPAAVAFEKFLLGLEEKGGDFSSAGRQNALLTWTYWQSSYAWPDRFDAAKADAVTRWSVERRWRIGEWAKQSSDAGVRAAAEKWAPRQRPGLQASRPVPEVRPGVIDRTAAERVLGYRRALGAWAFLLAVEAEPALARLGRLLALEQTLLPRPAAGVPE